MEDPVVPLLSFSEPTLDPSKMTAVLFSRRCAVIGMFGACIILGLIAIAAVFTNARKTRSNPKDQIRLALSKRINVATAVVFIVHSATGIYVIMDLATNKVFKIATVVSLTFSCSGTLCYNMLMMYQVVKKLEIMQPYFWKPISYFLVTSVAICKTGSIGILVYIASTNLGKDEETYGGAFRTTAGAISKNGTLAANIAFDVFKLYASVGYIVFIQKNIVRGLETEINQNSLEAKRMALKLKLLMAACFVSCLLGFIFAAMGVNNFIHHSVGIAIDSIAACTMLLINVILDNNFGMAIRLHEKLSSIQASAKSQATKNSPEGEDKVDADGKSEAVPVKTAALERSDSRDSKDSNPSEVKPINKRMSMVATAARMNSLMKRSSSADNNPQPDMSKAVAMADH
ncbi:UNVERIFIED_CONTAM: hypothetical protein HDU68_008085 [Siphonaria sp. JEL0065]|nr:hypothetical protein HDU68_008085 [Siphonaria sp. JEL0065]